MAEAALGTLQAHPPRIAAGDVRDVLPGILRELPEEATPVVYHSHALYQGGKPVLEAIREMLSAGSAIRAIPWLSCEGSDVVLRAVSGGRIEESPLAAKDAHGRWIEWLRGD